MLKTAKRYVTDRNGKRKAVVVPISEYRRLMEDLHDLAVVAERRNERPINPARIKRRLKSKFSGV